ncbi:CWC16 protein [Sporodiniella umbellata]|nr:CWC16 protein [Sporodiniella umbellata]
MQPFNKYYPPDWTPEKGSINSYQGKHALGDRARKLNEGILIVRFELPYNIWCLGCDQHVGQGVRYNAEKKKIGNYYSTPIFQFRMRCHLCSHWIEIHTDPKNTAYVVVSGAKKKVEEWDPKDTEVIEFQDEKVKEALENDPMYRLEHGLIDQTVGQSLAPRITQLQDLSRDHWADPYTQSQKLRKHFREEKKVDKLAHEASEKIRDKHSLSIPLLPEAPSDTILSKAVDYDSRHLLDQKRLQTAVSPLFKKRSSPSTGLAQMAKTQTRLKTDPFYTPHSAFSLLPKRPHTDDVKVSQKKKKTDGAATGLVVYSDSEDEE